VSAGAGVKCLNMAGKYIIASLVGSFALAFGLDYIIADKKIFGGKFWLNVYIVCRRQLFTNFLNCGSNYYDIYNIGTTPRTVSSNEWWEETDKKFQAWPRTAGPPVVMNPISRQNFIVKSRE
ncbi:hypothetical protein RJ639_046225, partial [Escallonia herrerae]